MAVSHGVEAVRGYCVLPLRTLKNEVLSGITVALALVPEAVAFSFVADVHPLVGLHAAWIMGLVSSLIGGCPAMISGATGAVAVVAGAPADSVPARDMPGLRGFLAGRPRTSPAIFSP